MKILEVKEIPVPPGSKHPPAPYDQLPSHEFSIGIIGKFY